LPNNADKSSLLASGVRERVIIVRRAERAKANNLNQPSPCITRDQRRSGAFDPRSSRSKYPSRLSITVPAPSNDDAQSERIKGSGV
jgi:hypothetical protein